MARTDAEFEQGAGTAEQLPQGATEQLNEALPTTTPGEPETALEATTEPSGAIPEPELAMPQDFEPVYAPESEEDDFIAGPTLSPDEPQTVGATRRVQVPPNVRRSLPLLQQMAAEPSASPQLRALVSLLLREANR
jgi:hypothetical protein